jgi:hypothetical protein
MAKENKCKDSLNTQSIDEDLVANEKKLPQMPFVYGKITIFAWKYLNTALFYII